ncbi:unnamed protein product [Plasmodium vivax]|uniref:(malaria parasite P. vivax) hypothetical protein n=1 Tax=Plasmodium vivax TaxID=5855 RepID=A0A8S4HP76_PLAVI|nr:unnamed protein product [Plasmodium vivax]CAG9485296.1 unnamed protein product [Plasmodium vivax]
MSFRCPDLDEKDNKNNEFHLKCGPEIFPPFRHHFDLENDKYLNHINSIDDPTLKYVSVYLVQYYKDGYKYFGNSKPNQRNDACTYLIRWLQERKELYTYGGYCKKKLNLWNSAIESLWEWLISDYKGKSNDQLPQTDQPLEKDQSKNLAVTSGFTAVGTLGTLFFLYRYTPVSSWFRRRGMNNIGSDLYMNPGSPDDFLRMQHDNVGNNLFYHPSV